MPEETAFERQHGVIAPRKQQVVRGFIEPDWNEAFEEFRRLRNSGLSDKEAVQVFKPLLSDPALRDAAQFILDCYGR